MPNLNYAERWQNELLEIYQQGTLISPFMTTAVKWLSEKTFHFTLPARGYFQYADTGTQVKNLQKFLNWYGGYNLEVDGDLGSKTRAAVRDYQDKEGLAVDGLFGKASLNRAKIIKK